MFLTTCPEQQVIRQNFEFAGTIRTVAGKFDEMITYIARDSTTKLKQEKYFPCEVWKRS